MDETLLSEKYDYPDEIVRLIMGELNSAFFEIALDLEIFTKLNDKNVSMAEMARLLQMPPSSCRVLVQFLCTLGLLENHDGIFKNSMLTRKYLLARPKDLEWIRDLRAVSKDVGDLKRRLLCPEGQEWYRIRQKKQKINEGFFQGWLHERRIAWGEKLAKQYDFSDHKTLLDLGGGCGGWCVGILKGSPHLQCHVFDLPSVCRVAQENLIHTSFSDKIRFFPGSFFENDLPRPADVVLLANVLHDWSPADDRKILAKVHKMLPPGGVLLISEFYFNDAFSGPAWAAVQALSVLGPEGKSGWQPTYAEMSSMLSEEQFEIIGEKENLIIARK